MDPITIGAIAIPTSLGIASLIREYSMDGVTVGTRLMIPYKVPLDKHLCVLGSTRSGKSSLVKAMIRELSRRYVVTVLDWHGEYAGLLPTLPVSAIRIGLEEIPPKLLTEILSFGLGLNEPSSYLLYRMIRDGGYTGFNDLIRKIDNYLVNTRTEAEMKAAILRRLEYAASNIGKGVVSVDTLMKGDAVIDLSDLTIIEEKRLISSLILAVLYVQYMRAGFTERGVRHIVVIEEAQNLLDMNGPSYSIIDHVIMELAKYGLRVVLVSNVIPRTSLLKHCNVVLFKVNPELMGNEVAFSRDLIEKLSRMTIEEALVITNKGITKVRPVRFFGNPNHIIIRGIRGNEADLTKDVTNMEMGNDVVKGSASTSDDGDGRNKVNGDGGATIRVNAPNRDYNHGGGNGSNHGADGKVYNVGGGAIQGIPSINTVNAALPSDDSLFRRQVMELEREVLNLRDRISEVERVLEVDEKMIEKILEFDDKLKKNTKTI